MALRCLATSDWHLEGMYSPLGPKATSLQFQEIDKVYSHAIANGFEHIMVPGDISDVPRLSEEAMQRLIQLLLVYDNELNTYYIRGNHDRESRFKTSLDVLQVLVDGGAFKRFKLFSTAETVKIDGVNCSFVPWPETEAPKAKDGRGRLTFCHIEMAGAIGDNGRPLKIKEDDVPKLITRTKDDYLISGHIHLHQELKSKRMVYVGTLYQKNFGESLPKGFLEIKAGYKKGENKLQCRHTFVNSRPNFVLEPFVVKEQSDWDRLKKDPNIRYKVFVDRNSGVVVPRRLTVDYPNVVTITGVNTKVKSVDEVIEASRGEASSVGDLPEFNPRKGLRKFLKAQGLEDKRVLAKAKKYVDEAVAYVNAVRASQAD